MTSSFLPHDNTVTLLASETGAQLLVAGFGLYLGKRSERLVVKQGKSLCAQVPFMRLQEVIVASRGVTAFSSDLIEELCERGIRLACISSSGKPLALITSPMLTTWSRRAVPSWLLLRTNAARRSAGGLLLVSCTTPGKSFCGISQKAATAKSEALRTLARSCGACGGALAAEGASPGEVAAVS